MWLLSMNDWLACVWGLSWLLAWFSCLLGTVPDACDVWEFSSAMGWRPLLCSLVKVTEPCNKLDALAIAVLSCMGVATQRALVAVYRFSARFVCPPTIMKFNCC